MYVFSIVVEDAPVQAQTTIEPVALQSDLVGPYGLFIERLQLVDGGREAAEETAGLEPSRNTPEQKYGVRRRPLQRCFPRNRIERRLIIGIDEGNFQAVCKSETVSSDECFFRIRIT